MAHRANPAERSAVVTRGHGASAAPGASSAVLAGARARDVLRAPPRGFARSGESGVISSAAPADRALLARLNLETFEGVFRLPSLRATPYKSIARVAYRDEATGSNRALFVKRYDYARADVFVRALLKANFPVFSGPTELANVLALRTSKIPAPRPLAAGETATLRRRRSFVVLEGLSGKALENVEPPRAFEPRRRLVEEVASLVSRLHAAGFWHKDLYLANVFWDEATGSLGLVDCERVRWRPRGPGPRARARDLGSLHATAERFSATDKVRFLRTYLGLPRLDAPARRLARQAKAHAAAILSRGKKG